MQDDNSTKGPILRKKTPYKEIKRPDHPLARADGWVVEHRAVLYDGIGPGPHFCAYCGREVNWYGPMPVRRAPPDYLAVDHHDGWSLNNEFLNLRPCCLPCNSSRGAKNQKSWESLCRFVIPKPEPTSRYRRLKRRGHPLATKSGHLAEHRAVLYEKLGPGSHPCHWCGKALRWTPGELLHDSILPDHVNSKTHDNSPGNIVASCAGCNAKRRISYAVSDGQFMAYRPSGMRFRAVWGNCERCGKPFPVPITFKIRQRFCSYSCAAITTNQKIKAKKGCPRAMNDSA